MDANRPPYWFWKLDRWKLLAALLLALLALFMALRGCGTPAAEVPEVTRPEVQLPEVALPDLAGMNVGTPFDLEGTGEPGSTIRIYDGAKLVGETVVGADGKWKLSLPALVAGAHRLLVRAFGADGLEIGASEPWAFELPEVDLPEVTLPEIQLPEFTLPTLADLKAGAPFDLSGTGEPGSTIRFYDGDRMIGETKVGADGKWKFALPALSPGAHSLMARAFDGDGKEMGAGEPWEFELPEIELPDLEMPAITMPDVTDLQAGRSFVLEGRAEPGARIRIFDGDTLVGETVAAADGKWKLTLPALAAGPHRLIPRLYDADGAELGAGDPVTLDLPEAPASPYPEPFVVTLAPGDSLSIPVRGYCLDYGRAFPGRALSYVEPAPDAVRAAIAYAVERGYVESDPLQVQLALWHLIGGERIAGQTYGVADEIIAFAEAAPAPEPSDVQTLATALTDKLVTAAVADFGSVSPANYAYQGDGVLRLENVSAETLTLLLPYGLRFRDAGRAGVQDMGIFPLGSPQD